MSDDEARAFTLEGKVIGRYRIGRLLGAGGMASVYRGELDTGHGVTKPVAVKVIHPHLAGQAHFRRMFLDEARMVSAVAHPNVCSVLDFGESHGLLYMVLEYLDGVALSKLVKKSDAALPPSIVARILCDAARGLHAAHHTELDGAPLRLVHRDVSPHNLVVQRDGNVKVVDFGIARAEGRLTETSTGMVRGKVPYMAPEQLQASDDQDLRVDVWSLCVVAWELLSGSRLFARPDPELAALLVLELEVPELIGVDPALEAIVRQGLERDPDDRFASAGALADALERWLYTTGEPCGAAQVERWAAPLFARRDSSLTPVAPPSDPTVSTALAIPTPSHERISQEPEISVPKSSAPESTDDRLDRVSTPPRDDTGAYPRRGMLTGAAVAALLLGGGAWAMSSDLFQPRVTGHSDAGATSGLAANGEDAGGLDGTVDSGAVEPGAVDSGVDAGRLDAGLDAGGHSTRVVRPDGGRLRSSTRRRDAGAGRSGMTTSMERGTTSMETTEGASNSMESAGTRTGAIRVIVTGPLVVFVDGRRVGRGSLVTRVPVGTHQVQIRDGDAVVLERTVEVGESGVGVSFIR